PAAQPRLVKKPVEIGGVLYPPGVVLLANAHLVHHDPEVYPDPRAFRPERFLEREGGQAPGTYTWIPFGGGRRRCLGVSFALLEMKVVLRTVLSRFEIHPASARPERARRRSITLSPARGGEVILRQRRPRTGSPAPGLPARMAAATAGHRRR
ncbi:MAG: cytochrome P450, partial [Solirubrobacteraceae bacterium]